MDISKAISDRIKSLCEARDITITDLAKKCCLAPTSIYSVMDGKSKNPGIELILRICNGFGITIQNFFDSEMFKGE